MPPEPLPLSKEAPAIEGADITREKPEVSQSGVRFRVEGFRIVGNEGLPDDILSAVVQPYTGREVGMEELREVAERVRDRYREAGYFLARALLPSQEVVNGIVTIRIIEGTIGKVEVRKDPEARVRQSLVEGYLGLLPSGTKITERAVERPLLLLNDLPGVSARSVLKQGAGLGEADLAVDVVPTGSRLKSSLHVDNFGNRNVGTVRVGADVDALSLLGLGELITVSALRGGDGLTFGRAGLTVPVGSYGTKLRLSYTDLNYEVGGVFESVKADGEGRVASLGLSHPLIRSRNVNVFLHAGVDGKRVNDRLLDGMLENERELVVGNIGLGGDFRDGALGGGLNSYSVEFSRGRNRLLTPSERAADQVPVSGYQISGMFSKLQMEYVRLQRLPEFGPFSEKDSLLFSLRAQYAGKNLDSSEKASLGGSRGVRAYPQGAGAGDNLALATLEYRHLAPSFSFFGASMVFSGFVDYGTARTFRKPTPADKDNQVELGAVGLGLNLVKKDDFQLRIDVARRVGPDDYQSDDDSKTRAWITAQKWF